MLVLVQPHDPILRRKAVRIDQLTPAIERFAQQMFETMYADDGVGLAAPQVGSSIRLMVMDGGCLDPALKPLVLVNPDIVWRSKHTAIYREGCLSLPGIEAEVRRPASVRVTAEQVSQGPVTPRPGRGLPTAIQAPSGPATGVLPGRGVTIEAGGWQARILQHEIDHLNGILFIDHVPAAKRWWLKCRAKRGIPSAVEGRQPATIT